MSEGRGTIGSYMHIGQHSAASERCYLLELKPAEPDEYADLKAELEAIGYHAGQLSHDVQAAQAFLYPTTGRTAREVP
jgi:hypothetical protein